MKVLLTEAVAAQFAPSLREAAPDLQFACLLPDRSWQGDPDGAEAVYLSVDGLLSGTWGALVERAAALPSVRWAQTYSVGMDFAEYRTLAERGIILTNGAGTQSIPIAQHVLMMMLHHAKRMDVLERSRARHAWERTFADELTGKTVALFGVGGIGSEVARLAQALRMRVIGLRRRTEPVPNVDELLPPERVGDLCAAGDYLVICAPLTRATRGAIGRAEFARMKSSAYLINVARGPLVDEAALLDALREGRIAGAGLDVFDTEPLPPEHPLWDLPNVLITPHVAPASPLLMERGARLFADNLRRFVAGEPLVNVVEPAEIGG